MSIHNRVKRKQEANTSRIIASLPSKLRKPSASRGRREINLHEINRIYDKDKDVCKRKFNV